MLRKKNYNKPSMFIQPMLMDEYCLASTSVESKTPSDPSNPTTPPDYKGGGDIEEDD
jgi:hypothetical protein